MPGQPLASALYVDQLLSEYSVAYVQNPQNFIAMAAAPAVPVALQSGKFQTWTKADWFRDEMKKRGPGAKAHRSGMNASTGTYSCDVFALEFAMDDQQKANDALGNLELAATQWLSQQALIRMERQFASDCFATSIWGTDVTGTTDFGKWSDDSNSDPKKDVNLGKETILKNTGSMPNTLIVGYEVHTALTEHAMLRDQFKYSSDRSITKEMIARYFEVDRYLVAQAAYNTAAEGAAASMSFSLGQNALLCYVEPSPGPMKPSAMYTHWWTGLTGGAIGPQIIRYQDGPHLEVLEIQAPFDLKVVASDMGYFFSDAVD